MPNKPFAQAAKQNRDDILPILQQTFKQSTRVLEIGSGTGQHAVYFARHLNHLIWQTSDTQTMLPGIQQWINEANLSNVPAAIELDVNKTWPMTIFDAGFAANVAHIMHWPEIRAMFSGLSNVLTDNAIFCMYGPFNINGHYTSDSNLRFDNWLKSRDPESGIRDNRELDELAAKYGFSPSIQRDLPANNKILSWTI